MRRQVCSALNILCMTANQLITQNCNFALNFLVLSQTSPISLRESGKYIYADSSTCLQTIYPWTVFQDDKSQFDLETEQFYNIFEFLWHRLSNSFQLTQAQLKFNPNYGLLNVLSSVHHVQCVNIILTSKCRYCRPSSSQGNPRTLQISIHNCNHIIQKLYGGFTYTKSFTEEPWKNSISSKNWGEARMLTFSPSFYYRDRLGQQNSLQQLNWKTMDTGITFLRYCQWHLLPSSSPPGLSTLVNQPRNNTVTPKWPAWYLHQCPEDEHDMNQLKANWQHQNQKHSVFTNKSK